MGVFHFEGVSGKFGLDSSSFREEVRATYSHKTWSLPDDLVISGNFLPIIVTKSIMQPCAGPAALLSSPILTSAPWGPALIKDMPTKLCFRVHLGEGQRTQAKTLNFFTYLCFFRINSYIWNCWVKAHFDFFKLEFSWFSMLCLPKYILLSIYFPASGLSCCLWDLFIRVCGLLLHCGTRASLWLYCTGLVALGHVAS